MGRKDFALIKTKTKKMKNYPLLALLLLLIGCAKENPLEKEIAAGGLLVGTDAAILASPIRLDRQKLPPRDVRQIRSLPFSIATKLCLGCGGKGRSSLTAPRRASSKAMVWNRRRRSEGARNSGPEGANRDKNI